MVTAAVASQSNWSARTRYIADLVDADAVVVAIVSGASGYSTYSNHNLNVPAGPWDAGAVARAMQENSIQIARISTPLADARLASDLCVAPLLWRGRTVGSIAALRVGRPWEVKAQRTLARSADLVALELAETHARQWWQRSADAWQRRIHLLEQTRRELGNATDISTIVEAAAKRVAELCGANGASLMLLDDEGQLVVRSAFGPHEHRARSARRQLGEGISGWVAQHGEPLVLRGRVEDPRFDGVDATIEESLVVPLRFAGRVVGVLATRASRSPDPYGDDRLQDLDMIAGELAILIAHAEEAAARMQMTTRLEDDRRDAVAMYDLARLAGIGADPDGDLDAAAKLIAEAFGHDTVAIWTLDETRGKLTRRTAHGYGEVLPGDLRIGANDPISGLLAGQEARVINDAASNEWRSLRASSLILVPILVAGESAGLMALGRRQDRYAQFDLSLAATTADVLSSLVRREIAAQRAERSELERQRQVEQIQGEFAQEMGRVVYVLDACQRLLGQDRSLPSDIARAARDARSSLDRLGIALGPADDAPALGPPDPKPALIALEGSLLATHRA